VTPAPNAVRAAAEVASMSARAWSQRVTTTARGIPTAAHSSHWAMVAASISPAWRCVAGTTNSAASAARRPARSSPTKSP
jgi:hypothetical protein